MKIFRTMAGAGDESGEIVIMDTIEHEGRLWLVPEWLSPPTKQWQTPARIVCIHGLQYQDIGETGLGADYLLNVPVPKSVLDGETDTAEGQKYVVIEKPDIRLSTGSA